MVAIYVYPAISLVMKPSGKGALILAIVLSLLCSYVDAQTIGDANAFFFTSGIRTAARFFQIGPNVRISLTLRERLWWEMYELPVDLTIDSQLRCSPEYLGRFLGLRGGKAETIYGVTTASLVLHSIVLHVVYDDSTEVACGTIVSDSFSFDISFAGFKTGLFGRIYFLQGAGDAYIAGRIQTERSLEHSNDTLVPSVNIVLYNTTLGPYDIMLHGCDGFNGTAPLQVLVADANYLPNASFSRQLETFNTNYNGHAVSVQTSSGNILGCGRIEPLFTVEASYRGKITFSQYSQFLPAAVVDSSQLKIFQYNILDGIAGTCSSRASVFDPWRSTRIQLVGHVTSDQFPVGDLPNHRLEAFSLLPEVPLIGRDTVLGHAVNDSECNSLELAVSGQGHVVKGNSVFGQLTVTGIITFSQAVYLPDWVLGPTVITVNLSYTDLNEPTSGYEWYIHEGYTEGSGICTDTIGALYNPYGVSTTAESGYFDDCTSLSQERCAMGDLSGKLGTLGLETVTDSSRKTYNSFYDETLHLLGPFTVFGRTIVVYGTGAQSGQLLGCANIEPSLVAEEEIEISFPRNGTNPEDIDRFELGHFLSTLAGVPLGDVLVNDVRAVNISGQDCLTASLWITGVDAENVSLNALNVRELDRQNLSKYSAGPCVPPPTVGSAMTLALSTEIVVAITAACVLVMVITLSMAILLIVVSRKRKEAVPLMYKVDGQQDQAEYSPALVKLLPSKKDRWELLGTHFKVGTKLGEGNYGQVYKGTLSMGVATTPAKRHIDNMMREGKPPYTVAVKVLKGGADERAVENFLEEIAMMKKVSSGECCHVVQMVGCVSTALPLALVLEFVPFGNLLSYLKYWRQKVKKNRIGHLTATTDQGDKRTRDGEEEYLPATNHQEGTDHKEAPNVLSSSTTEEKDLQFSPVKQPSMDMCTAYINDQWTLEGGDYLSQTSQLPSPQYDCIPLTQLYLRNGEARTAKTEQGMVDREEGLYSAIEIEQFSFYSPLGEPDMRDLPSFAHQISQGMEYLSSLGVLHRDLACRNILVDERKLLKISDFGLSRDTPEYVSSLKDKMPLRWMAPETVTDNVYTDKSDVWAFGVCLWEMCTLGELPYQDVPLPCLLAQVLSGYRLPKPEHASETMYQLMLSCWRIEPQARLTFTQLQYSFKSIVATNNTDATYITVQPSIFANASALFSEENSLGDEERHQTVLA